MSSDTNSSLLWKKVTAIKRTRTQKKITLINDGKMINEPNEIADLFASQYSSRSNGVSTDNLFRQHKQDAEKNLTTFSKN